MSQSTYTIKAIAKKNQHAVLGKFAVLNEVSEAVFVADTRAECQRWIDAERGLPTITRVERQHHCRCILNRHLGRLRCDHGLVTEVTWKVDGVFGTFYRRKDAIEAAERFAAANKTKEA